MGKLTAIEKTMFNKKDDYVYLICNGYKNGEVCSFEAPDYIKLRDFISDMYIEENVYDLDSYVDFRIRLNRVLDWHGLNSRDFKTAISFAKFESEDFKEMEDLYNKLDNPYLRGYEDHKMYPSPGDDLFGLIVLYVIVSAILFIPAYFLLEYFVEEYMLSLSVWTLFSIVFAIYTAIWIVVYICDEVNEYRECEWFNSSGKKRIELGKKRNQRIKARNNFWDNLPDLLITGFNIFLVLGVVLGVLYYTGLLIIHCIRYF